MLNKDGNMDNERFIASTKLKEDEEEVSLRPKTLTEYIGQEKVKESTGIYISAAKKRKQALDHVLLYGPPGLGKTTLAQIIANELGVGFSITSGPAIEKPGDLAALLTKLEDKEVLFIDEIHRLNRSIEEILYPAMEDYCLDIILGKGPSARSMRIELSHFTLIGATTRTGSMTSPLRDRFGIICRLELYTPEELATIIRRSAGILKIEISDDAANELARRSRGTPRIANRLLKRARDYAEVKGDGTITKELVGRALEMMDVDSLGLDYVDKKVLKTMIEKFGGGPVGLDTLSASVNEESITIEDVVEPYLLQLGFISRTSRGRVVQALAYKHLGCKREPGSLLDSVEE